ncbi:hypothetical protein [Streptacidiphilus sp. PAMC 29251]
MTRHAGYRFIAAVRRRRRVLGRWLPPLVLATAAVTLFCCAIGTGTPAGAAAAVSALPMLLVAGTWPLWRAPGHELPELVRWRHRQRRICWRIAVLLLLAASVALVVLSYWTARRDNYPGLTTDAGYGQYAHLIGVSQAVAAWSAGTALVPVLLDPVIWRIWTYRFRGTVRSTAVAMALQDGARYRNLAADMIPAPGFDPEQGWCGRPHPVFSADPPDAPGEPCTCHPRPVTTNPWHPVLTKGEVAWQKDTWIAWDGETLTFSTRRKKPPPLPVATAAELVLVHESGDRWSASLLMLLDATGQRLVTLWGAEHFDRPVLAGLAVATGLPFAEYQLGMTDSPRPLYRRLFPAARDHVNLGA